MLYKELEKAFDKAVFQIVPGQNEANEECFKAIVLDSSYQVPVEDKGYFSIGDINNRPLQFKVKKAKGPGIEFLYISCILAVLRRKRYNCPGMGRGLRKAIRTCCSLARPDT